jgi:hypothetical protein
MDCITLRYIIKSFLYGLFNKLAYSSYYKQYIVIQTKIIFNYRLHPSRPLCYEDSSLQFEVPDNDFNTFEFYTYIYSVFIFSWFQLLQHV